eukprot:1124574-Prymnesium_polylepis.1
MVWPTVGLGHRAHLLAHYAHEVCALVLAEANVPSGPRDRVAVRDVPNAHFTALLLGQIGQSLGVGLGQPKVDVSVLGVRGPPGSVA